MASRGAEYEDQINDWMKAFEGLPDERKELLARWFGTQKLIIDYSGLTEDEWFGYVEWALKNPFDYRFVLDFPDEAGAPAEDDAAEETDQTRSARDFVGFDTQLSVPDGPGMADKAQSDQRLDKELFDRFMRNRKG